MKYLNNREDFLIREFMNVAKNILGSKRIDVNDRRFKALKSILGNNLSYIGLFTHYLYNNGDATDTLNDLFKLIKKYKLLLNNVGLNPLEEIPLEELKNGDEEDKLLYQRVEVDIENYKNKPKRIYKYYTSEMLEDAIMDAVVNNERLKFAKKFISNKYKHLINDDTLTLFGELKDIGEKEKWKNPHNRVQKLLTTKLKAFKTPDDLNDGLRQVIKQLQGDWNTETIIQKIEKIKGKVTFADDRFVIVDIKEDKKILDKIGSPKWCIFYSDHYFNDYVKFPAKQYVIYDTELERDNEKSLIGVTINWTNNELGKFRTAHDREDKYVNEDYLKNLGIREYLKRMSKEEMIPKIPEMSADDVIKYGFADELLI
jgi:hypothetical protein